MQGVHRLWLYLGLGPCLGAHAVRWDIFRTVAKFEPWIHRFCVVCGEARSIGGERIESTQQLDRIGSVPTVVHAERPN